MSDAPGPDAAPARPKVKPPREVDYNDVDDVIGIASEMQAIDQDRLSVEDLEAVASDLDMPKEYVRPAIEELRRRRAARLAQLARKMKIKRWIVIGAGALVVLLALWAVISNGSLGDKQVAAENARAQVRSLVEARAVVVAREQGMPESREKMAALSGADTRVTVAKRRYDEAVLEYNQAAGSFPGSLWAAIFGRPSAFDTSDQVAW